MEFFIFAYGLSTLFFALMVVSCHDYENTTKGITILVIKVLFWWITVFFLMFKKDS